MQISGAEAIIKMLEDHGVEMVFGYPGATNAPVYDVLSKSTIRHILTRNEQAAAHAANGYARISGRVGVCMATSGPGATNLITGIATAHMDSVPIVAITGQVATRLIGHDAFQEVDITGAVAPFCKHSYLVTDARSIPRIVNEAFHIASTGRRGPVLIDLPIDIAQTKFEFEDPGKVDIRGYKPTIRGNSLQIKKVCKAMSESQRPVIIAGGGVVASGAQTELAEIARRYAIPMVTTLMGIEAMTNLSQNHIGMIGTHGCEQANRAVAGADLILALGARLGDRAFHGLHSQNKKACLVHIDIDPAEIGKSINTNIPIVGDVKTILGQILELGGETTEARTQWLEQTMQGNKTTKCESKEGYVNPKLVMAELTKLTKGEATVVTEVGQNQIWAANSYKISEGGRFITSGGLGTMGFGLPAAIGAKLANGTRTVIAIEGDGSFQMSLPELATMMQHEVALKIILFKNERLGMVRELQKKGYGGNYFAVNLNGSPDFVRLAEVYGLCAARITDDAQIEAALRQLLSDDKPYLLEVVVDPEESTL